MYIVSANIKNIPLPAWFELRLFSNYEKAAEWFKALGGQLLFEKDNDSKLCSIYSCGDTTLKLKKVVPDESCPEEYKKLMDHINDGYMEEYV